MSPEITIRPLIVRDKANILQIIHDTQMFTPAEEEVAKELIDIYLTQPMQKDYCIYVAEDKQDGNIFGYVCFGPTPATQFTFDIYWIAVDPPFQKKGIGLALLHFAEKTCFDRGGKLLIIETSSTEKYTKTRNFYLHNGYQIEAQIKDFYAFGDDRVIFTRRCPENINKTN